MTSLMMLVVLVNIDYWEKQLFHECRIMRPQQLFVDTQTHTPH